ncbi:hypothetical protein [Salinicola halophilus]|uniref:hypothetical protein n=1 Tax=Salinicola halophilus TaxID=184065 RepID=UPI000DA24BF6|nr:hypothetical protein [Salinicola halophilus]
MTLYLLQNCINLLPPLLALAGGGLILVGSLRLLMRRDRAGKGRGKLDKVMKVTCLSAPFVFVAILVGMQQLLPNHAETEALAARIAGYPTTRITLRLTHDIEARRRVIAAFTPLMRAHEHRYTYRGRTPRGNEVYTQRATIPSRYRSDGTRLTIVTGVPVRDELLEDLRRLDRQPPAESPPNAVAFTPFIESVEAVQIESFKPWLSSGSWNRISASHH